MEDRVSNLSILLLKLFQLRALQIPQKKMASSSGIAFGFQIVSKQSKEFVTRAEDGLIMKSRSKLMGQDFVSFYNAKAKLNKVLCNVGCYCHSSH